jgi:hypothetical protein
MGIYDLMGCLIGTIAAWAGAVAGAALFGLLGGIGFGVVGFFLGFMGGNLLVAACSQIGIVAERREVRRDLVPHFGTYWTKETTDEWQQVRGELEPGDTVAGAVVAKYYYGVYLDVGLPFPARLTKLYWDDAMADSDPGIGARVTARVHMFDDRDHEIELAQVEPLGGFGPIESIEAGGTDASQS